MWSRSGSTSSERSSRSSAVPASWRARTDSGSLRDHPEHGPAQERREDRRGEHAELRLLELLSLEREARDQQRDREADAGHRPGADDLGPARATAAGRRGVAASRARRRRPLPTGLPTHVAEDDPQRDRRRERVAEQVCRRSGSPRSRARTAARSRSWSRVQPVLQAFVRRDRRRHAELGRARELRAWAARGTSA